MDNTAIGRAGLKGWRSTAADAVAPRVAQRSGFTEDQVRAVIGGVFLLLSIVYVVKALRDVVDAFRELTD